MIKMRVNNRSQNTMGERTYKYDMFCAGAWANGFGGMDVSLQIDKLMLYPNGYLNMNQDGEYTKHYYADALRIASKIGSGKSGLDLCNEATAIENAYPGYLTDRINIQYEEMKEELWELVPGSEYIVDITPIPYLDFCNIGNGGQETGLFFYHPDHLGSTGMVTDNNANITQGFLYAPFGELLYEYSPGWQSGVIPKYSFNAKELDEENGMYYYSARYYAPPTFISRDPLFEKYPSISPYAYCANNPMKYVDPTGEDVDIAELYKRDKKGKLINSEQVKAFEAYMNTKTGRAEVAKYAKAGQTIAGHTFKSDGEYHKSGVDIAFKGDKGLDRYMNGSTDGNIVNGRLKIDIAIYRTNDIGSVVEAFAHEMLIHGRQFIKDFKDDKKLNFSHAYKGLCDWLENRGLKTTRFVHHYQESESDKVMKTTGIQILREYYKNAGIQKSESDLKSMIEFER